MWFNKHHIARCRGRGFANSNFPVNGEGRWCNNVDCINEHSTSGMPTWTKVQLRWLSPPNGRKCVWGLGSHVFKIFDLIPFPVTWGERMKNVTSDQKSSRCGLIWGVPTTWCWEFIWGFGSWEASNQEKTCQLSQLVRVPIRTGKKCYANYLS